MIGGQAQRQECQRGHVETAVIGIPVGDMRLGTVESQRQKTFPVKVPVVTEHTVDNSRHGSTYLSVRQFLGQPSTPCQQSQWLEGTGAVGNGTPEYADALQYDGASFWQNTSHGSVPGIPTRVDMNYQFKDYSSVIIADGFADRGDQKVFYANYRMQRSCWVGWEDKKYHLDENGFVQKGCWFEDETGRYFLATKDGHALREDVTIEGVEYYFDENAVMQRGLVTRPDGNTYYYDENGALQRDVTVTIDGITYEVNKDGVAAAVEAPAPEAAGEPAEAAPQPEAAGEPAA